MGGEVVTSCDWEPVEAFDSLDHYKEFLAMLEKQVAAGKAQSVTVDPVKRWGSAWKERWFECTEDHRIWRLVAPDSPFPGAFDLV
jgi:hypothetical protein